MIKTKRRILHISIFTTIIMITSGCGGGLMNKVKHSAANNIHRVAIVSVLPGEYISKPHKNKRFYKTVDIASSGLTKVKNWKVKHPKTFWKSGEYNDFSARVTAIWSMYTKTIFGSGIKTGYGVKMPNIPFGSNIAFAGSKISATNEEYKKLCNTLNVDALAFIEADYNFEEVVMSPQEIKRGKKSYVIPSVSMFIRIINKFGDTAVLNGSGKIIGSKKIYLIDNQITEDLTNKTVHKKWNQDGKLVESKVVKTKIKGSKKFINTYFSTSQGINFEKDLEKEHILLLKKAMSKTASNIIQGL